MKNLQKGLAQLVPLVIVLIFTIVGGIIFFSVTKLNSNQNSQTPPASILPSDDVVSQAQEITVDKILNVSYSSGQKYKDEIYNFENGLHYFKYLAGKSGNQVPTDDNSDYYIEIQRNNVALGDLNGDGIADAVVFMGERYGGTGYFVSLSVFTGEKGEPHFVDSKELGDRVIVQSAKIENGIIIVELLTHDSGEPLCCANTKKTIRYKLVNNQLLEIEATNTSWKTYRDENYGFQFQYPSTWFIHNSNDDASISFTKSSSAPLSRAFMSFYITDLNVGKQGAPHYVTPQEYFNYYFGNDSISSIGEESALKFLQLGQVPVARRLVPGDNRYVIFTVDRQLSFVLYPGSIQNPTEYTFGDDLLIEQVIKTLIITNPSRQFVKIIPPETTQESNVINKHEWGISFSEPSNWDITSNTGEAVLLKQVSGDWAGDTIDVSYVTGEVITTTDSKFGSVTYYFDKGSGDWMKIGQSERTGEIETPIPATRYAEYPYVANTFPVFTGTSRWLTLIVPLSHKTFLKLHITGSGQTQPLKDLLRSIKKI